MKTMMKLWGLALASWFVAGCHWLSPPISGRKLPDSHTVYSISAEATTDPAFLTPLPVEAPDKAGYLPADLRFQLPFTGTFEISNGYGFESDGWTHQTIGNTASANDFFALDISMPEGTPVLAPADGRILTAQDRSHLDSYGKYIVIDHGKGVHSVYAHLSELAFEVDHGRPEVHVRQGQQIGLSGKTGTRWPHLHFAIHRGSRISHSGADVGGKAIVPEPLGGYYGIRKGHVLSSADARGEIRTPR